jgi:hypothetical protein
MTAADRPNRRSDDPRIAELNARVEQLLAHETKEVENWETLLRAKSKNDDNWQFEKRVSVGNLLTMLVLVATLFGAWSTIDRRLSREEVLSETQAKLNERVEHQMDVYRIELKAETEKINVKLDRQSDLLTAAALQRQVISQQHK